jgi:hypothetical protein
MVLLEGAHLSGVRKRVVRLSVNGVHSLLPQCTSLIVKTIEVKWLHHFKIVSFVNVTRWMCRGIVMCNEIQMLREVTNTYKKIENKRANVES